MTLDQTASGAPTTPARRLRARIRRAVELDVGAYVALVAVAAFLSLGIPPLWDVPRGDWLPAFVVLTALSAALEFVSIPLPRGGDLSVATISHVATLLLIPAPFAALSIGAAITVEEVARHVLLPKLVFNVSSHVLTASLTSLALGLVGGDVWAAAGLEGGEHVRLLVLFVVAAVGYYVTNAVLLCGVIALATGDSFGYLLKANTRNTVLSELGAATVGGLFALIWTVQPIWTAFLAVPAAVTSRSLRYIWQLESETRSALHQLARIIDHRDRSTFHHSERVSGYASALARELRLDDDLVDLIGQAASLHDLGKIGVPDRILLKPGPLTPEEQAAMWLHTEIGARILDHYELFREGSKIALHHHESYDGTGYPHRLKGDQIPLGSRVIAVADAFDAMTSDRPYRKRLPIEEALARLRAGAGTQWDPAVVGAFLKLLAEGRLPLPEESPWAEADAGHDAGPADGARRMALGPDERASLRDLDHPVSVGRAG